MYTRVDWGAKARARVAAAAVVGLLAALGVGVLAPAAHASCTAPANAIEKENCLPGTPQSEWDISGAGSPEIQGFATRISVNRGQAVQFKIDTPATAYHLDIYRMGYYGGDGARKVATVQPSVPLPQSQPACANDAPTGLIDCGNWAVSASWAVPADATSGIYFAKLVRDDGTPGASHIVFVVRDDAGRSNVLFQTSDSTWQAYNQYGGNSLYVGGPGTDPARAYKVSYNRPFTTRGTSPEDWVFNAEYPMVRWLERNGYDVSYFTGVDSDHSRQLDPDAQDVLVGRPRRVLVGAAARQCRGGTRCRREPRLLQRQRGFLEDALGERHRRVRDRPPHPGLLQGDARPTRRSIPIPPTWTGTWRDPRPFNPPRAAVPRMR